MTHSDEEKYFNPELPTEYKSQVLANPEKDLVIKDAKPANDEGKSEKTVPESTEKSSTESPEASKPKTSTVPSLIDQASAQVEAKSSHYSEAKVQYEDTPTFVSMLSKKDFLNNDHLKSGDIFFLTHPCTTNRVESPVYTVTSHRCVICTLVVQPINGCILRHL